MNKKILIIDDEADSLAYLSAVLAEHRFEPITAGDAHRGLRLARKNLPAVICLDIMMPRETGLSLLQQLKGDPDCRSIPVLVISGVVRKNDFDKEGHLQDIPGIRPDEFMEKPIKVDEFVETVTRLAGARPARTQR
jgi:CheY-like chemotaxis protein